MCSRIGHMVLTALLYLVGFLASATAQNALSHQQIVALENNITIMFVSGDIDYTTTQLANELAIVLDAPETLRVLPVLSGGGEKNVSDLLYLKGVDVGFVRYDVLSYVQANDVFPGVASRLLYISKLHNEEVHLITGPGVTSISDLADLAVNFGRTAAGNKATGQLIFETLGIAVQPHFLDPAEALKRIKTGEIAATVVVNGKPNAFLSSLDKKDGLKLLPIPFTDELSNLYLPASLSAEDYPGLIAEGDTVDTLATAVIMAMYNWPKNHARYDRTARFVQTFFSNFKKFRETPRHPKWKEVNLSADLPGWTRFTPAQEWLDLYGTMVPGEPALAELRKSFEGFLNSQLNGGEQTLSDAQRKDMFLTFLSWKENLTEASIQVHLTSESGVGKFVGSIKARNTTITVAGAKEQALYLEPSLKDLTPGPHAFHIHSHPNCGPGEKDGVMVAGLGAGGHLFAEQEGVTFGSHLGDLPDLIVASDTTATEPIIVPRLTLADLHERSIMVHATGSDTSGRMACGVIN